MESKKHIAGRLDGAWQRERIYFGGRGFFNVVLWAIVLLTLDFVLDFKLRLPGGARLALLAVNAVVLVGVMYWTWLRRLKRYDALRVALQVERVYPQLGSILVSYVQFSGKAEDDVASPELIEAMRRQAVERSEPLDFGKIVRFRKLRSIFLAAAIAVVAAGTASFVCPSHFQIFMERLVNSDAETGYPTRTVIDRSASTGKIVVQQGRTVILRAVVGGVIPENARLTIVPDQGRAEVVTIQSGVSAVPGRCEFIYRVEDVYRGFTYTFRAGDDVSTKHVVSVIAPPVVEPRVELQFPAYCGRKPEQIDTLNFEVLEGSRVVWHMKTDREIRGASMIREGCDPLIMKISADGHSATVEMTPDKTFTYGFQWVDKQHRFVYDPDVRYGVNILPDVPPRVSLLSPVMDETVTTKKAVELAFQADDDYGVVSARILYKIQSWTDQQKTESEERAVPLKIYEKSQTEVKESFRWDVRTAIPELQASDEVIYCVEVTDSRVITPGTGRSAVRRLKVVSDEEYERLASERRKDLLEKIKDLYQQEGRAADAVKALRDKE